MLGRREVAGRSGDILEGESGANDPVGIALMASLITAGGITAGGAAVRSPASSSLQMGVGLAVGVVGGRALLWFIRAVAAARRGALPAAHPGQRASSSTASPPWRTARGSWRCSSPASSWATSARPYKREIERFHSALASLARSSRSSCSGLTVTSASWPAPESGSPADPRRCGRLRDPPGAGRAVSDPGPAAPRRAKAFILFAGLKGAVPILLASYLLAANMPQGARLYGIVVVVVVFSVLVQGSLVPTVARAAAAADAHREPEPWALGVRLRDEPEGVHRFTVAPGSPADGRTIEELANLPGDVWVSFVVRDQQLLTVRGDTTLRR